MARTSSARGRPNCDVFDAISGALATAGIHPKREGELVGYLATVARKHPRLFV
ncbi:MAG TPA: hypothetical protein VFM05_12630 [Candidatus Saccharimonadales bacterium]|nr:hypothetical protein [Candidatus Saccharimonadales bacterium]